MSNANGSRLFAGDTKSIVRILTISLFSTGALTATLYGYQQSTKPASPDLISEDEAIQIAITAGDWNEQTLRDKKIEATLVHVKENVFSFVVDENTLHDTLTLHHSQFPNNENQYLWLVGIIAPSNRDWGYTIDAATGEIVTSLP